MESSPGVGRSNPPIARHAMRPAWLLMMSCTVAAAIGLGLWVKYYRVSTVADPRMGLVASGFNDPVVHKLAPQFTDADGDMVADAPTDPAKWIDPPVLHFCFVATDDAETNRKNWQAFSDYLSKATGKPVEYLLVTSTHDELKAMQAGDLQVAGFNTGNVPTAVNLVGFVPVCAIPTFDGGDITHTDIIVPADGPIQRPQDLKGKELTLTDLDSNSGCKAPLVLLRNNFALQPLTDLLLRYSHSHEASISGIASHKYEAAAVADDMLCRQLASGGIKADQYRIIYRSDSFPTAGLGYVYNLKPTLARKVRDALLSFDSKGTALEGVLNSSKRTTFLPVNYKNDWSLIRWIDDQMGTPNSL
jgi:phosphonate transport system substrate-binding protein